MKVGRSLLNGNSSLLQIAEIQRRLAVVGRTPKRVASIGRFHRL
jgi:hypothetical protein